MLDLDLLQKKNISQFLFLHRLLLHTNGILYNFYTKD